MYHKVRIKKLPKAKTGQQVQGALAIQPTSMGGADIDQYIGKPNMQVTDTLSSVPREEANLEAEGGETAYGDINGDGFTEHYKIKGPRHSNGGVALDLPEGTFIFSDTRSMKIKDCEIIKMFNKSCKKSYTPAELANSININHYRMLLQDPDTDGLTRKTAELMIRNYNMKLGALALAQEALKGFPQGIPEVSIPYMNAMGIKPEDILPVNPQEQLAQQMPPQENMPQGMPPQQMPSGEPIAMSPEMMQQMGAPQEMMPPQEQPMMAYNGYPMAMYGMEMGGYDLPWAQIGIETMGINDPYPQEVRNNQSLKMINMMYRSPKEQAAFDTLKTPTPKRIVNELGMPIESVSPGLKELDTYSYYDQETEDLKRLTLINNMHRDPGLNWALKASGNSPANFTSIPTKTQDQSYYKKGGDLSFAEYGMTMGANPNNYMGRAQYADGGLVSYEKGGAPYSEKAAYTPEGVVRLNKYRSKYGLPPIGGKGVVLTKADINNAAAELQQSVIDTNPDLVLHYLQNVSHQPSNELKRILKAKGYPQTNEGIKKAIADGKLTAQEAQQGYKDKLWWYRVLDTQEKELTKDEYEKKMKEPGAIKQGDFLYFHDDPDNPEMYTRYTMKEEPAVNETEITVSDEEEPDTSDFAFPEQAPFMEPDVPWSTQASRSYMNALRGKYSRDKQYPWAAQFMPTYPEPTYLDPTRAIAAQAEMANIFAQGLGQFVGPQAASARAARINAQAAKQAADTIANVYNQNVGIANQFGLNEAQISNQAQLQNQAVAKQLYDQTNYMNDQYRKEGLVWDQAAVDIANAADTEVQKLKMMNQLTPQYGIYGADRKLIFKQGKAPKPEKSTSVYDIADMLRNEYGLEGKDAIIQARLLANQGSGSASDLDAMMAMYGQMGGSLYSYNTFPFII